MLKDFPKDLALVILITLSCMLFVLIPPLNETPVRIILGLLLVLFLPGYSLIAALFPRKDDLDGIERIALSFGLSIAVVPLLGLALNYTPFGIRLVPILVVLSVFTVSLAVVAGVRRQGLPEGERFVVEGWGFERRFLSPKTNLILVMVMRMKAIYQDAVLKPLTKLDLRDGEEVEIALKTTPIEKLEGLIKISNRKWVEEIIESPDLEPG